MTESEHQDARREAKIKTILAQEVQDGEALAGEANKIVDYLLREKKGYGPADVRRNVVFDVHLGAETVASRADFLVSIGGRDAMVIKCAAGSLDSRQRQVVAAARIMASTPVPVAVVADPTTAHVLDAKTGKLIGEGFGAIPLRAQLAGIIANADASPLPAERLDREKRILLAFDAIQCCVPRGADGGVAIGDPVPGDPAS